MRATRFHPFVAADYEAVRAALLALHTPGRRFLEWGSASGVITVMADLVGFDACGIELDPSLVATARALAARHDSRARFVAGSFLPAGYRWRSPDGDTRTGHHRRGALRLPALGRPLDEFDVVFGYPWGGEAPLMRDVIRRYGRPDALLLLLRHDRGRAPVPRRARGDAAPLTGGRRVPLRFYGKRASSHRNVMEAAMGRVELVRGTLDVMILKALAWGPKHGYAVTRWVADASGGKLDVVEGALYPALHRLERRDFVTSDWGLSENNRQARFYRITAVGRRALTSEVSAWEEYVALVGRVLAAPASPATAERA